MQKNSWVLFLGMAFELATLVVTFLFIGRWVDGRFGFNGLGVAAGAFLGLGLWVFHLVLVMNQATKLEEEQAKNASKNNSLEQ